VFNLPQLWANYLPHFTFILHFFPKSKLFANIFCCSFFAAAAVVHTIETKITLKQL